MNPLLHSLPRSHTVSLSLNPSILLHLQASSFPPSSSTAVLLLCSLRRSSPSIFLKLVRLPPSPSVKCTVFLHRE
ncbi:autotransporter domain-containing protein [Sesbania bispinosa]|nr:autotransporter domain-containing protein [Sesbania bispinosa]